MQEHHLQDNDKCLELIHELWLIHCQLKDAEVDPDNCEQRVRSARAHLGRVVNALTRFQFGPKSPRLQAANLNCRDRQKDLTPDSPQSKRI